jgi:hypothetical protein
MGDEPIEPGELVVEFRTGLRVAVGCVERGDDHAVHRCLDVAALPVAQIARQRGAGDDRSRVTRENGDAVPGLLSAPDRLVAGARDVRGREYPVAHLQFLQADDVRRGLAEPGQEIGQPPLDIVNVEGGDFHAVFLTQVTCATAGNETRSVIGLTCRPQ